ncbi:hypothetical protein [Vibrio sp. WXL103]|uniref:hypothetical protein n=1 Tax=unclassified Vibrio TaxID=2614977 RepID=UPI003EC86970
MKLMVLHGLLFFIGIIGVLYPYSNFTINGVSVSYEEWWSSGSAIEYIIFSFSIGMGALSLLRKIKYARAIYFGVLAASFAPSILVKLESLKIIDLILGEVMTLGLLYWYLFHKKTVQRYF